jgi:type IV pilus assembly protein PilY1
VGTGKYLETSDLTNPQVETIYAIKDDDATTTLNNPRAYTAPSPNTNKTPNLMVKQTMTSNGNYRVITDPVLPCGPCNQNPVDFSVDRGWYIDLPDTGERVNIDSKLVLGALLIPSIVPSNTVCSPGGYGWMNFLDFTNGWPITDGTGVGVAGTNTNVSVKYDATIVGMNILYIQGKPIVEIVTSDNPTPTVDSNVIINPGTSTFSGSRVQWRELLK